MDMDSVMSGRSERSERSQHSHHHHHRHHGHHRHSRHGRDRHAREPRDDRSVTIRTPGPEDMADPPDDRFEVQIIPQDDTWADNTTAITGNTSETGFSMEDLRGVPAAKETGVPGGCGRWARAALSATLAIAALLSPVLMALLPPLGLVPLEDEVSCEAPCVGGLLSLAFRVLFLAVVSWAVFLRLPRSSLPRLDLPRALTLFLIFLLCFSFWLFYGVSLLGDGTSSAKYRDVVSFATSLADTLLFTHLTLLVISARTQQTELVVRVLRSPDGETRSYRLGAISIQRAAVQLIQRYYTDFPAYNAWLDNAHRRRQSAMPNFKVYDVDGAGGGGNSGTPQAVLAASARRRDSSHNQRFYEEVEYERRVRKRRARLLLAADEAFTHVRRLSEDQGPSIPMDPQEAAQAIFPSMARALQKYLRVTRQQPRYTMEAILGHLASCLSQDLSSRAFLQRYLLQEPSIHNPKEYRSSQTWTLVSHQQLNRPLRHETSFLLRQGDVTLACTSRRLPHLSLREQVQTHDKFVLRLSSETSV